MLPTRRLSTHFSDDGAKEYALTLKFPFMKCIEREFVGGFLVADITSVSAGIQPVPGLGEAVNAGHLFWTIGYSDGSSQSLQAGPSGPDGTGNLVTQPSYTVDNSAVTSVISSSTISTQDLGANLLAGYDNFQAQQGTNPIQYSDSGGGNSSYYGNSNGFDNELGLASGLSQNALNQIFGDLQSSSGLSAYGNDLNASMTNFENANGFLPYQESFGSYGDPGTQVQPVSY